MYVYMNDQNEIKSVDTPIEGLTGYYINDDRNPFSTWSAAKICCYKADIRNGIVYSFSSYINYDLVEHIDQLGLQNEGNSADIVDTQLGLTDTFEAMELNAESITQLELAVTEIYEMMIGD